MTKKQKSLDLVFGIHSIIELLKAKRRTIVTIYTTKPTPKVWPQIQELLSKGTQIQYVEKDVLTRLAQTDDHQGVVAWATEFPYRSKPFEPQRHTLLVMLDAIQDPRNLGAIIRSAYCIGASGVILTKKSSSSLTATALKASAGLAEHMEIYQTPSAATFLKELKKAGYHTYLATLGGQDATKVTYEFPACVVIGNEATGISPELFSLGTQITLPQRRADISYNASVAAGILLFLVSQKVS